MTTEQQRELIRAADQAEAHGHVEVARWYRIWAETGRRVGEKPDHFELGTIYNGPES